MKLRKGISPKKLTLRQMWEVHNSSYSDDDMESILTLLDVFYDKVRNASAAFSLFRLAMNEKDSFDTIIKRMVE